MNVAQTYLDCKDTVAEAGYELTHRSPDKYNLLVVKLHNGIEVQVRQVKNFGPIIIAAYRHKQLDLVKQWFTENGYDKPEKGWMPEICINTTYRSIHNFIAICKHLEDIDGIIDTIRGRTIDKENYFMNVAKLIKQTVDMKSTGFLDRGMFDKVDNLISVNKPLSENSYREHVVPCTMILDNAIKMFEDNKTEEDVAQMIEDNLKIVHITKDQAKHLDIDLGLRTSMPDGWAFGDNIFARLDVAEINY